MRALLMVCCVLTTSAALADGVLLVPDSGTDRVWSFSPVDGSLINDSFIPDDGRLATVTTIIDSGAGSLLLSDQTNDAIMEYDYSGNFVRTVTDNDASGIDNIRGIAVRNGQIYVSVASGVHNDTVQRFDMDGSNQSTFATGIESPWFILFRDNDMLVSDSGDDQLERFALDGTDLGPIHDSDGQTGIDFPRQIVELPNSNLIVGGFSVPAGIYEYDADGNELRFFDVNGIRGLWLLENGLWFWTAGTNYGTLDPDTGEVVSTTVGGSSFQHVGFSALPEPASLLLLLSGAALIRRR